MLRRPARRYVPSLPTTTNKTGISMKQFVFLFRQSARQLSETDQKRRAELASKSASGLPRTRRREVTSKFRIYEQWPQTRENFARAASLITAKLAPRTSYHAGAV